MTATHPADDLGDHTQPSAKVGFIGLGHMGEPMATRLAKSGTGLMAWNRTSATTDRLSTLGVRPARCAHDVFAECDLVILMLANGRVIDEVLGRHEHRFAAPLEGRIVVNMGTVSPEYSRRLHDDIRGANGRFVEAPVSGSRVPAETGALVAMLAGESQTLDVVEPLLKPLTAASFRCGDVPRALETKLAVNVFLIAMVAGLAEAVHFAERRGLDLRLLEEVLSAGPMASAVSRIKLAKLVADDRVPQASVHDVLYNNRLIVNAAAARDTSVPLLARTAELFAEAERLGRGTEDMVAVIDALRARSADIGGN